jgi:carbon storage regulator
MLILTRRPGESLYVGATIKITVLDVQGHQVKVGLDVPSDMTVYREELYMKVREQNNLALSTSGQDLIAAMKLWQNRLKKKK